MLVRSLCVLVCIALTSVAQGQFIHNEAIDGDLSNDRLNPTQLALGLGTNTLIATSIGGNPADREYVRMDLPAGLSLSQVMVVSYGPLQDISFIGVQAGTTMTEPPTGTNVANLLGWTHFGIGNGTVGTDILDDIGVGAGAIGFAPPLTGPSYTFWIQQTTPTATSYQLDFIVTPEPATIALLGISALMIRRRR